MFHTLGWVWGGETDEYKGQIHQGVVLARTIHCSKDRKKKNISCRPQAMIQVIKLAGKDGILT
jgi:hypothetical protein